MNTLDGIIADLERDDTHIGGCTTAGEVVLMLKQLRDDTIVIPAGATNGDVIKALFPHHDIEIDEHTGYLRIFYDDFYTTYPFKWWNAPYKREGDGND